MQIVEMKDQREPLEFVRFFLGWHFPEEQMLEQMSKEAAEVHTVVKQYAQHYTLEQLQRRVSDVARGC